MHLRNVYRPMLGLTCFLFACQDVESAIDGIKDQPASTSHRLEDIVADAEQVESLVLNEGPFHTRPPSVPEAPLLPTDRPLTVEDVEAIWRSDPERAKLPRRIPVAEVETAAVPNPPNADKESSRTRSQTHSHYEQDRETGEWVEQEAFRVTEVTNGGVVVMGGDMYATQLLPEIERHANDDDSDASDTRRRRPDMHPGAYATVRTEVRVPSMPQRQHSREIVELTLVGESITRARLVGDRRLEFKSLDSSVGSSEQGVIVFEEGTPWHPRDADFPVGHDLEVQFDRTDGSHGRVFGRVTGYLSFGAQTSLSVEWNGLSPVFNWSAPLSSAGPIAEVEIRIMEAGQLVWQSSVGADDASTVYAGPSLRPGTRYHGELEAVDSAGNRGLIQSAFVTPE